ncbi:MAG: 16S rRNA methyltransferase [Chloroflexi bacterium]|nr:MAG: 16S rRNA methyltransferase [Chloroflexota bacterium]
MPDTQLEKLITAVSNSPKYRHISPDLIRRICERELVVRRSPKEAIKATKNKLHQIGGAYQDSKIDYAKAIRRLEDAASSPDQLHATCRDLMRLHTSTRERLPIIDSFYQQIFAELPPINSVLDIASGLNPLAIPWMPLADNAVYYACDIYADMMAFLHDAMSILGVGGRAEVRDVVGNPPTQPVDLALILKTLPVLEMVDKTAVSRLLNTIQAKQLLITFPVRSLGGRSKGMIENYTTQFNTWATGRNWQVQTFTFESELAFLVSVN